MPGDGLLVTGEIVFENRDVSFSDGVAYVMLEDISKIDAPSAVIAEQVIRGVSGDERTAFSLYGPESQDQARVNLRVHVSLNGSRDIEAGDYITTQSYPVSTRGNPDHIKAQVRRVG